MIPNTEVRYVGAVLCRPAFSRSQRRQADGEGSAPRVRALGGQGGEAQANLIDSVSTKKQLRRDLGQERPVFIT